MKQYFNRTAVAVALTVFVGAGVAAWSAAEIERQVQQAARHNFVAANLATGIQIDGERMRRYEKEAFIYASVPDKRAKYVKDFEDASTRLIDKLNAAQASALLGFDSGDRTKLREWVAAAIYYDSEFHKVIATAATTTSDPTGSLTGRLNANIGPGKDRFRTLLDEASAMREAKQKSSEAIGSDISASFNNLTIGLFAGALLVSVCVGVATARRPQDARLGQPPSSLGAAARTA